MDGLRALSVRQPWAWAIIYGGKDIENRSAAAVRWGLGLGRIAIHASKTMTRDEYESARTFMAALSVECPRPDDLIRGAIIGTVTVTEVVSESDSGWFMGPRGLVLADPHSCQPIPASGLLGYFEYERAGEIEQPKRWMVEWPRDRKRASPPALPLLEGAPQ